MNRNFFLVIVSIVTSTLIKGSELSLPEKTLCLETELVKIFGSPNPLMAIPYNIKVILEVFTKIKDNPSEQQLTRFLEAQLFAIDMATDLTLEAISQEDDALAQLALLNTLLAKTVGEIKKNHEKLISESNLYRSALKKRFIGEAALIGSAIQILPLLALVIGSLIIFKEIITPGKAQQRALSEKKQIYERKLAELESSIGVLASQIKSYDRSRLGYWDFRETYAGKDDVEIIAGKVQSSAPEKPIVHVPGIKKGPTARAREFFRRMWRRINP